MKLHLASDLHIDAYDFDKNKHISHWQEYDVVVTAGDVSNSLDKTLNFLTEAIALFPDTYILFVAGNHDFYFNSIEELHTALIELEGKTNNFTFLRTGTVFHYDEYVFIGDTLWTDYNLYGNQDSAVISAEYYMNDYRFITVKELPSDELKYSFIRLAYDYNSLDGALAHRFLRNNPEYIFNTAYVKAEHTRQRDWILKTAKEQRELGFKVCVVTHHAPNEASLDPRYTGNKLNPCYASNVLTEEEALNISYWFHGHTHSPADYEVSGTRVIAEPTGYSEPEHRQLSFILEL